MNRALPRTRYLDDDELRALLKAARANGRGPRDHALLAFLVNVGCRPGEAVRVRLADLDLTEHRSRVRIRRLKKRADLGVIDDVPLSRALAALLRSYLRACVYVRRAIPQTTAADTLVFPITVRQAERVFDRYAQLAGLAPHFTLYCLRHTAGTRAYALTKDIRAVQELLGHASVETTQIYTHVNPAARRELAELAGSLL